MEKKEIEVPAQYAGDEKFAAEWTKMLSGEIYDASYPPFIRLLEQTRLKVKMFNDASPAEPETLRRLIRNIIPDSGCDIMVNQPFRCDYGFNIRIGSRFFANFNLTILDEALVTIGDNVFIGPNVSIYTACHPTDPVERNRCVEWAEPVTIGHNVWIGGSVTILPGVTIGDNVTIGAGSVVTRSIPVDTIAAGNPCRPIRHI